MSADRAFRAWAPSGARWTPWVKPVLFAHLEGVVPADSPPRSIDWAPFVLAGDDAPREPHAPHRTNARRTDTAVIVDLQASRSLAAGLALLSLGFFPVPLFNALPAMHALIPLQGTLERLAASTELRASAVLPADAPPAFLLDRRRDGSATSPPQVEFDNRSFVSATDFPSPQSLVRHGIARVVVVTTTVADDLADVLIALHDAGLELLRIDPAATASRAPTPLPLVYPSGLQRLLRYFFRNELPRRTDGSFGRTRRTQHHG